jgi:hypothetical protein
VHIPNIVIQSAHALGCDSDGGDPSWGCKADSKQRLIWLVGRVRRGRSSVIKELRAGHLCSAHEGASDPAAAVS